MEQFRTLQTPVSAPQFRSTARHSNGPPFVQGECRSPYFPCLCPPPAKPYKPIGLSLPQNAGTLAQSTLSRLVTSACTSRCTFLAVACDSNSNTAEMAAAMMSSKVVVPAAPTKASLQRPAARSASFSSRVVSNGCKVRQMQVIHGVGALGLQLFAHTRPANALRFLAAGALIYFGPA